MIKRLHPYRHMDWVFVMKKIKCKNSWTDLMTPSILYLLFLKQSKRNYTLASLPDLRRGIVSNQTYWIRNSFFCHKAGWVKSSYDWIRTCEWHSPIYSGAVLVHTKKKGIESNFKYRNMTLLHKKTGLKTKKAVMQLSPLIQDPEPQSCASLRREQSWSLTRCNSTYHMSTYWLIFIVLNRIKMYYIK